MRIFLLFSVLLLLAPSPPAAAGPADDLLTSLVPLCHDARDDLAGAVYYPLPVTGDLTGELVWTATDLGCFYTWIVVVFACGPGSTEECDVTYGIACAPMPRCLDADACEPWPACRAPDLPPVGIDSWPQSLGDDVDNAGVSESETVTVPSQTVEPVWFDGWGGVHESVYVPYAPAKDVNKPGWQGIPDRQVPTERTCVVPQVCVNPVTVPGHPGWEQETLATVPGVGGYDQPVDVGPLPAMQLFPGATVGGHAVPVGFGVETSGVSYVVVVGSETLPGGSVLGVVDYCPDGTCPSNADAGVSGTVTYGVRVGDVSASDAVTLP